MADTIEGTIYTPTTPLREERAPARSSLWSRLALVAIMVIAIILNFYQLGQSGYANAYYAASVRSMLDSLHNFFFVSLDPGGFVTIDKPPLGFWLQTISAKIFGFSAFSILLPQALAGVLSVALLYHLVRRRFGVVAGLLAALALAISPISVATNRNNTIDSTLTLVLLLGAWAVFRAAETGKLRWLLLTAVAIGLGFNVKMMEAYLVVPAYGLLYLLAAPHSLWKRIWHLALAAVLMLTLSLAWMVAVDLTPSSQRPWVGSTQNNSEISLAIGYNGVQRLLGQFGGGPRGGNQNNTSNTNSVNSSNNTNTNTGMPQPATNGSANGGTMPQFPRNGDGTPPGGGGGMGGGGMFGTGTAGPLRLFQESLGGQIAWLLPAAILGAIALAWQRRPRLRQDRQQQSLVVWGVWLLTMSVFFSIAGFFHPYYLTIMAPAIAALFGIGAVTMWHDFRYAGWKGWLLPVALIATAAEQIYILSNYPTWGQWLIPIISVLCIASALVLLVLRLAWRGNLNVGRIRTLIPLVSIALLSLTVAPAAWSAVTVIQYGAQDLPSAGPSQQGGFGGGASANRNDSTNADRNANGGGNPGGGPGNNGSNTQLIAYLEAHQGSARYLVATASSQQADSIILATNKPVMALGGFSGSDPILTTSQLASLVKNGTIRYFLINSGGFGGPGGGQQSSLTNWITQNCTVVPSSQWQSASSTTSGGSGSSGGNQLYICNTN
jgi:4-amino-4-deoxy-L-arabinose transferase-like glycosyltransferase